MNTNALACVVSPNVADAELAVNLLGQGGVEARAFASVLSLAGMLDERTGCVVIVEEALVEEELPALREALARVPAWCDVPLILVSRDVAALGEASARAFPTSGNVTLLERPLNPHTLFSAVQVALRATARQREVGELIAQRERAVKLRDEFLAMLAHELRNPLAPMRNALYLMRKQDISDPLVLKSTEILERQVEHVIRMVDDLMDVARLERGKVVLQKGRVDLNRIVASAVETCLHSAQQNGHRISVRFWTEALPINADEVRLEQIVCNLVNNAVKFSPEPSEIRVETSVHLKQAEVAVEDQGIGFDPGAAQDLFQPFMQANPTLARTAGGLGMGLTIVKRLAELHGGGVRAISKGRGKGSRFVVTLPLAAAGDVPLPEDQPKPTKARPRRVALIEDNADIRETVQILAQMWGHELVTASDGRSGVALVLEKRPEIALIDIGLPGMNGYDVAREIRRVLRDGEIRLVAVTGYGQPADRELALQAGFDRHLLKPIAPGVLEALLAEDDAG